MTMSHHLTREGIHVFLISSGFGSGFLKPLIPLKVIN